MKVITPTRRKGKSNYIRLTRLRKRTSTWSSSNHVGGPVFLTTIKSLMVIGTLSAVGVGGHGLLEISKGEFTYTSQDQFLTLENSTPISTLVTTKGEGAGTTITDTNVSLASLVSIEKVS